VSKDPHKAPRGSFHYWDIGVYGHVAVGLGGEEVLMASAHVTHLWGNHVGDVTVTKYNSITGAKYLGWSETNGANDFDLVLPTPPKPTLEKHQRQVGAEPVIRRARPTTKSADLGQLKAHEIGNFDAWTRGEKINGSDVWFRGTSHNWFWAGGFTDHATHDLPQITAPSSTPVPPKPAVAVPAVVPAKPITPALDVKKDAENKVPKVADNSSLDYTFDKDLDIVTQVVPVPWENFDQDKPFPSKPQKAVIHQFGTPGSDTFQSTINWFTNPAAETSSHFVVSGKHIVQMVSIHDRAWHAGPAGTTSSASRPTLHRMPTRSHRCVHCSKRCGIITDTSWSRSSTARSLRRTAVR
jgi:hypothetical protein